MAKLEFEMDAEGRLSEWISVTMPAGNPHQETLTAEPLAAGEKVHAWISKENPQNAIEFITYSEMKAKGDTVIINHNVPFGKEVWGTCAVSQTSSRNSLAHFLYSY